MINIYVNITPAVEKELNEGGNAAQGWKPRMKEPSERVRKGELGAAEGDQKKNQVGWDGSGGHLYQKQRKQSFKNWEWLVAWKGVGGSGKLRYARCVFHMAVWWSWHPWEGHQGCARSRAQGTVGEGWKEKKHDRKPCAGSSPCLAMEARRKKVRACLVGDVLLETGFVIFVTLVTLEPA